MSKRFRYEKDAGGGIKVFLGNEYITTCNTFSEILNIVMHIND